MSERTTLDTIKNFAIGGLSGMTATSVVQPVDMVKVRIQLKSEAGAGSKSPFKIAREIYKNEGGLKGFYAGIDSALMRQAVYASLRLGLYFNMSDYIRAHFNNGGNLTPAQKISCSLVSGAVGAFVGNPFDVVLVRMQADKLLPESHRRNYRNFVNAFYRIVKEEGIMTGWYGVVPTMCRSVAMTSAQIVTYEEIKERIEAFTGVKGSRSVIVGSSMISSVATAVASLPFDNIKTKLQKMKRNADGTYPYKGVLDCAIKTAQREGPFGYWVGLGTYYARVGPHSCILLVMTEVFRRLFWPTNRGSAQ